MQAGLSFPSAKASLPRLRAINRAHSDPRGGRGGFALLEALDIVLSLAGLILTITDTLSSSPIPELWFLLVFSKSSQKAWAGRGAGGVGGNCTG